MDGRTRWSAARTLEERVQHAAPGDPDASVDPAIAAAVDAAAEYWRRSCGDAERLALRLRPAGIDEDGLRALVAGSLSSPGDQDDDGGCGDPAIDPGTGWAAQLRELYARAPDLVASPAPSDGEHELEGLARQCRRVTAPVTGWAAGRLAAAGAAAGTPIAVSLASALVPHVVDDLADLVHQVVAHETGGDAAVPAPDGWALMTAHPALARLVHRRADAVVDAGIELIERVVRDGDVLVAQTWGPAAGSVVDRVTVAGDSHAGARRTTVISFSDGTRVLYKPRSHELEERLLDLLTWLDDHGAVDPLRLPRLVARPTHAWVEHVGTSTCTSPGEVRRYFRRLGAWMAVLHALGGTDVHSENLIACGDTPVPIDLECLFATAPRPDLDEDGDGGPLGPGAGGHGVGRSVLSQHVLRVKQSPTTPVDTSAIGAGLDDATGRGDDAARGRPGPNLVTLQGEAVQPAAHVDSVVAGFAETHAILREHRGELVGPGGPVAAFRGCEVRFLLRPTDVYARLLRAANHPAVAGDGLERDAVLAGLWRAHLHRPELAGTIGAELADLRAGDVPRFTAVVGSDRLRDSTGRTYPQVDGTRLLDPDTCLERLDARDRTRQLAVIRSSVEAMDPDAPWPGHHPPSTDGRRRPSRPVLVDVVGSVARRVERLAFSTSAGREWPALVRWREHDVVASNHDLGSGTAGCALFLAATGAVTGWERGTVAARAVLDAHLSAPRGADAGPGPDVADGDVGFDRGAGGALWGMHAVGRLLGDADAVLDLLERRLPRLRRGAREANRIDVASGIAGLVPVLVELSAARPGSGADEVLATVADRLAQALGGDEVTGDATCVAGPGFGRGRAGVAVMLLATATRAGRDDHTAVALEALRTAGAAAAGGQDDRTRRSRPRTGWQDGPVGTGLAVAAAVRLAPAAAPDLGGVLDEAVRAAVADGLGHDHSLVTGDLGVAELLRHASEVAGRPDLAAASESVVAGVVDDIGRHQPRCGHRGGTETAALLPGLAGIGYALLTGVAGPDVALPSVLAPVGGPTVPAGAMAAESTQTA